MPPGSGLGAMKALGTRPSPDEQEIVLTNVNSVKAITPKGKGGLTVEERR